MDGLDNHAAFVANDIRVHALMRKQWEIHSPQLGPHNAVFHVGNSFVKNLPDQRKAGSSKPPMVFVSIMLRPEKGGRSSSSRDGLDLAEANR